MSKIGLSRFTGALAAGGVLVAAMATGGSALASTGHSTSESARTDVAAAASSPKPTVVLVHGAWANSSSWDGVIKRLQQDGYPVVAPPTSIDTLSGDVSALRAYLSTVSGPLVLVGHSYGGAVISNAAVANTNVKALVYIDAFAPEKGEAVAGLSGEGAVLTPDIFKAVPTTSNPDFPDLFVPPQFFASALANDLPVKTANVLAAAQTPGNAQALYEPSDEVAWKSIPSWYLIGTLDKAITPAQQLVMARRAKARIVKVEASHLSMVSHPAEVEKLIETAARATS